jgi:hypothetical protein
VKRWRTRLLVPLDRDDVVEIVDALELDDRVGAPTELLERMRKILERGDAEYLGPKALVRYRSST